MQQIVKPSDGDEGQVKTEGQGEPEAEAFEEVSGEKQVDKKEKMRVMRSMTIQINEEGHPLWTKVDEIWEDAKLKDSETLKAADAKADKRECIWSYRNCIGIDLSFGILRQYGASDFIKGRSLKNKTK